MSYYGDFAVGSMVDIDFPSQGLDGASITLGTDGTLRIYKNGSITQRTSLAGVTFSEDFDGTTGWHHIKIDTSDNTDAGFYAAASEISIGSVGIVVDGKTVNTPLASFSIERAGGALALVKAIKVKTDQLTFTTPNVVDSTGSGASAAAVADAVWDELTADHVIAGSTGEAVAAGGSAGDPWITPLPGAYAAGTAGKIVGDRIAASVTGAVGSVAGNVGGNVVGSVASVTGAVGDVTVKTGYRLSSTGVDDILRTALPESYAADGAAGTLTQLLYLIQQLMAEKSITTTTMTVKKLDGSTTAATFTLNSATTPTAVTRTT